MSRRIAPDINNVPARCWVNGAYEISHSSLRLPPRHSTPANYIFTVNTQSSATVVEQDALQSGDEGNTSPGRRQSKQSSFPARWRTNLICPGEVARDATNSSSYFAIVRLFVGGVICYRPPRYVSLILQTPIFEFTFIRSTQVGVSEINNSVSQLNILRFRNYL